MRNKVQHNSRIVLLSGILLMFLILGRLGNVWGQTTVTLPSTASGFNFSNPFGGTATNYSDLRYNYILLSSELTTSGLSANAILTSIGYNFQNGSGTGYTNMVIAIKHTTASTLAAFDGTGLTNVYSGTYTVPATGWQQIPFSTNFTWNGTDNLLISVCWDRTGTATGASITNNATGANRAVFNQATSGTGCLLTTPTVSQNVPITRFTTLCSGTPSAGTATPATQNVVLGSSATVSISNSFTTLHGISFQWQQAPLASGPWTAVSGGSGATTASYTSSAINNPVYFRCVVTCSNGGGTATSSVAEVIRPYCASNATNPIDSRINNVTFNTINQTSPTSPNTCQTYTDYTDVSTTVTAGTTYLLSFTLGTCDEDFYKIGAAYIDWNMDGDFLDADEFLTVSPSILGTATHTANITIPNTAITGNTRLRVVCRQGSTTPPSCGTYSFGETEDYTVNILASPQFSNISAINCEKVVYNNMRDSEINPRFSLIGTTGTSDRVEIELNTKPDFTGTAYSQVVSGSFYGNYNVTTTSINLPTTNNVIYYVRVRDSKNGGSTWSSWSNETWTYIYSTATSGYHVTAKPQFDAGGLVDVNYGNFIVSNGSGITSDNLTLNEGNFSFNAGTGDGVWEDGTWYPSVNYMTIGWQNSCNGNGIIYNSWPFVLNIPKDAAINSANFSVVATDACFCENQSVSMRLIVDAHAQDNAPTLTSANTTSLTGRTNANQTFQYTTAWSNNTRYTLTSVSNIVQEIVNRPGWNSGNNFNLLARWNTAFTAGSNNNRCLRQADNGSTTVPRLEGTFTNFSNTIRYTNIQLEQFGNCMQWDKLYTNESVLGCGSCSVNYRVFVAGTSTLIAQGTGTIDLSANPTASAVDIYIDIKRDNGSPLVNDFTLTVKSSTNLSVTPPSSLEVCPGENISFSVNATGCPPFSYNWRKDGVSIGAPNSNALTINNVDASNSGNYDVVVTNNACVTALSNANTITVNPAPTISTTGTATSVCISASQQTTSLTYTATTNSPNSYSIDWNAAANTAGITDQGSTAFTFAAGGGTLTGIVIPANLAAATYSGIMTITNANGCTGTQAISVTVNPSVTVNAFSPSTSTRCQGSETTSYTTTANNSTGITYSIDATSTAGGVTINSSTGAVTYPSTWSGTTTITASAAGCSGPVTATHIVTTNPPSILWANTQSPATGAICSDGTFNVYGQVYIPGITDNTNQGANVTAQLGYHTSNTDPSTWPSGNWVNATYNSAVTGNNDEYMGTLSGLAGNTYYYAFRYSYNGCAYVYGGYSAPSVSWNTWTVNTPANSGVFIGNSNSNGSPGSSGINTATNKAFGLWSSGGTSEAIRNFPSLLIGQTLRFDMDNGNVNNGGTIGVGLQNSSGQNVWEIYFSGGTSSYVINSGSVSPAVNIPFTANGLRISFTLTSATTYSATIQTLNGGTTYGPYTGSLLNPTGGQSITRFRAFNFNSGSGSDKDFFINSLVTPSFYDDASTYSTWSNSTQSTTSVGGIWNSPTIGNGPLTVTTSPIASNAGSTQTICEGTSTTLVANAPSPSTATGAWSISSGPNTNTSQLSSTSANNPVFTPTAAGIYTLVWTITNGSCTSTSNVTITVTSGILNFVNTQFPGTAAICVGQSANVYGQVFEPGVTPNAGQGANIEVQVGYNTSNDNPNSWNPLNWSNATYNTAVSGNNDEYIGTFGSALSAGTYYYAFRYRLNGCAWQYGGYSIGGGGTWNGTNNINGVLTIYGNTATAMTPSSICAGVSNVAVTGSNAGSYELFVNGISQGVPSTANSWTISGPLVANDQVCVRGYAATNLITMDGAFNEPFWSPALVNSAGGAASGTGNRINALYVKNAHGFLNIGIAGRLVAGEDRKILLFVDSKNGGHNSLSTWTNRSGVTQNNGLKNLNGGMQFDPGFSADYAISIGTNSLGESFLDFYDMINNNNNYIGSTISHPTRIAYQANANAADYTKGYEIRIPINLFGIITSPMKFFAMLTNNPTDNSATTLSNQFLSAASSVEGDYGNGPVNFGNAAPNPVSYVLESDCYTDVCRTVVAPTTPTFSQVGPYCSGALIPALPTSTTNTTPITGTWSPAISNTATNTYTFSPNSGQCATSTTMQVVVNQPPSIISISPP